MNRSLWLCTTVLLLCCVGMGRVVASATDDAGYDDFEQSKVSKLTFSGNESFSASAIKKLKLRSAPTFFHKQVFSDVSLRRDTLLIDGLYQTNGFLKAKFAVTVTVLDSVKHYVKVNVAIQEGPRTIVSNVSIQGVSPEWKAAFFKHASVQSPDPLNITSINADMQRFASMLADSGYLEAAASYELILSPDSLQTQVNYTVAPGAHIRIASVAITGLKDVDTSVVTRELKFHDNEVLTRLHLRKVTNRLYATNVFNVAMLSFDSLASANSGNDSLRVLRASVFEAKFFSGALGVGYQTYEEARVRLELTYNNLFGDAIKAYGIGYVNKINRGTKIGFTVPWIFGLPVDYDAYVSYKRQDEPKIQIVGDFTALHNDFTYRASQYITFTLQHKLETCILTMAPPVLPDSIGNALTHSIGLDVTSDFRDDIFDPHTGTLTSSYIELSGIGGGESNRFVKLEGDGRWYIPLRSSTMVLATGIRGGIAIPYGVSKTIPVQERYYLGGSSVMRGFSEKTMGPADSANTPTGGTMYLAANVAELRFPLYRGLWGDVFLDAGNLWDIESARLSDYLTTIAKFNIRYNAGFGLRLHLPVVIVSTELGFKLDKHTDESLFAFHFNIGHSF